jgi:hypothetical protein
LGNDAPYGVLSGDAPSGVFGASGGSATVVTAKNDNGLDRDDGDNGTLAARMCAHAKARSSARERLRSTPELVNDIVN